MSYSSESSTITIVPEVEESIGYRFDIILVSGFANSMVDQLRALAVEAREVPRGCQLVLASHRRHRSSTSTGPRSSSRSSDDLAGKLSLFVQTDIENQLARLKIVAVDRWDTSLPQIKSYHSALHTGVMFMHCSEEASGRHGGSAGAWACSAESSIEEFRRRIQEINARMKFQPMVFLLCMNASAADILEFAGFVGTSPLKNGRHMVIKVADASGESLVKVMSDVTKALAQAFRLSSRESADGGGQAACCSLS